MDIDGDGTKDILSGCYSQSGHEAMVGSFWMLRGRRDGTFAKPTELTGLDGKLLRVYVRHANDDQLVENICTRPFATDWDGDGHLDIVSGNFKGTFFWFRGKGLGKFEPKAMPVRTTEGAALQTSSAHSDPFVIDWDGDGDLDLLSGDHSGVVQWAENTAEASESDAPRPPVLAAFRQLIGPTGHANANGPSGSIRIHVEDADGDGKLDILVGDRFQNTGRVWLYRQR